ncbi:MAG: transposase [Thermoleophilaceae bacterium]|nr:transposase [Thermoleophilaceae bacterium]
MNVSLQMLAIHRRATSLCFRPHQNVCSYVSAYDCNEHYFFTNLMAHRYRAYPSQPQAEVLSRHCSDARFVWNLALEQLNHYDKRLATRRPPGPAERSRQLTELRATTWLGSGSSPVQQQALRDFDRALENWWGKSHRRPTWRKAGKHESFCIRDVSLRRLSRKWASIQVPKCGWVRLRLSRPLPETFGMARVTIDRVGRWHVAISSQQPQLRRTGTGALLGIDMGIASTVTTSDGAHDNAPVARRTTDARKIRLQRKLSRQDPNSIRRARTRLALAKLGARQSDRLNDWREKATTQMVLDYDFIAIEDLNVRDMMASAKGTREQPGKNVRAKSGLNRAIARQGWSAFARRLEEKAQASGVEVIRIPARNTSIRCSVCRHTGKGNRKNQADFMCVSCGHREHADVNAAKNILAAGLAATGRGGIVGPIAASAAPGRPNEASTALAALAA